jgi:hypothetical protein
MAVDFLGKSLVGVDMCSWDDEEHGWDEHEGATVTNAEADAHAAAPMAAAAAVATGDFMFHSGLLWVEMSYPSAMLCGHARGHAERGAESVSAR